MALIIVVSASSLRNRMQSGFNFELRLLSTMGGLVSLIRVFGDRLHKAVCSAGSGNAAGEDRLERHQFPDTDDIE